MEDDIDTLQIDPSSEQIERMRSLSRRVKKSYSPIRTQDKAVSVCVSVTRMGKNGPYGNRVYVLEDNEGMDVHEALAAISLRIMEEEDVI